MPVPGSRMELQTPGWRFRKKDDGSGFQDGASGRKIGARDARKTGIL
jgi:hypothetical protein